MKEGRKAQVTIFIIAAVVLVAIILLFLVFRKDIIPTDGGNDEVTSPGSFLETCIKDSVYEAILDIEEQGGYINPPKSFNFKFTNEPTSVKIGYLCYTDENKTKCINQAPMLFSHVEKEIKDYTNPVIERCFENLISKYTNEGYAIEVKHKPGDFSVEIKRKLIDIKINGELILTKTNETTKINNFEVKVPAKIYDLIVVAQRIINDEMSTCNFDISNYFKLYPKYDIELTQAPDFSEIYTIKYQDSPERFRFAIRGCTEPP